MDKLVYFNGTKCCHKGKDVKSVNTEQECSHIELSIFDNSNRLVYLTSRITAVKKD